MTRREAFAAVPPAILGSDSLAKAIREAPNGKTIRLPESPSFAGMTADELEELAATLLTEANKRRKE